MIYKLIVVLDFGVYKFIIYKIMNEVRGKIYVYMYVCVIYQYMYECVCIYMLNMLIEMFIILSRVCRWNCREGMVRMLEFVLGVWMIS